MSEQPKYFTPKAIADAEKKHAKTMADENARRDLMMVETLVGLEHSMRAIAKRIDDFNDEDNNLAVMRVIRSWFAECRSGTTVVQLPQKERWASDQIEIIALDRPLLFTELNGAGVLCGGDDPKSSCWDGTMNRLLYFRQYKSFPAKAGYEVKLMGDLYKDDGSVIVAGGQLTTAPCVIMSYDDGRIGLGSENGEFPWSQVDAARRAVTDGMVKEGDLDVVIANNIRLISAMRRFIDSFKGLTHLVGLKSKGRNDDVENHLRKEIRRYSEYDAHIKREIARGPRK